MVALVRRGHDRCSLPNLLSGVPVERHDDKLMLAGREYAAEATASPATPAASFTVASALAAGVTAALAFALGHQTI